MKKLLGLLFVSLMVLSCSIENDNENSYFEILAVESFEVPEAFEFGRVYTINVFYKKPNDCHLDASLYFERNDSTRVIAIQSLVLDRDDCKPFPESIATKGSFQFEVLSRRPYVFKFFKGKDEDGANIFEEVIIPVIN